MRILARILLACLLTINLAYADQGRNQGAVNNLCQNLTRSCKEGNKDSCKSLQEVGCKCDKSGNTCTRGNYSNN